MVSCHDLKHCEHRSIDIAEVDLFFFFFEKLKTVWKEEKIILKKEKIQIEQVFAQIFPKMEFSDFFAPKKFQTTALRFSDTVLGFMVLRHRFRV